MIKKFFGFFILSALAVAARSQSVDVLNYKFIIGLTDENDTIQGNATIQFISGSNDSTISFDLTSVNAKGKGMFVYSVDVDSKHYSKATFTQIADKLLIHTSTVGKNDTAAVRILYKGVPDDGLIISKNKYGDRTFFADNWPNRAHHWIPCNDRPDDKASFIFSVIAPDYYKVISNGTKIGEEKVFTDYNQTTWKEDTPLPTKVMVIGVARFATKTFDDSPKDIPVSAWVYPQDSTKGFYDYGLAPEILKFYSNYIAPYPYEKLANVQSKTIFGGMENASCIFYAEESVTGTRSSEDLLAHEIAHQWFGDMASEKSFAHLWLSEGFATYFTNLYLENKYGREALVKRLKKDREKAIAFTKTSSHPVVDSTKDLMSLLNANSYQKGGWILHMLRNEVGDTIFQKIIQAYYNHYKGSNADTRDFEMVAEKVSGKDLKWFFDQWLYQPGIPQLNIEWKADGDKMKIKLKQTGNYLFQVPLEVLIIMTDGKQSLQKLAVRKKENEFTIDVKSKPVTLAPDPNTKLLFDGKIPVRWKLKHHQTN